MFYISEKFLFLAHEIHEKGEKVIGMSFFGFIQYFKIVQIMIRHSSFVKIQVIDIGQGNLNKTQDSNLRRIPKLMIRALRFVRGHHSEAFPDFLVVARS